MSDVKFTLSVDERQALERVRGVDGGFKQAATSAQHFGREVRSIEQALGRLNAQVNFHGSRRAGQIAGDMAGRLTPAMGERIANVTRLSSAQRAQVNTLRSEAERLRAMIASDPARRERLLENNRRFEARLPADGRKRAAIRRQISATIQQNELGNVDDEVVRGIARSLMVRTKRVNRVFKQSLREVAGNAELLTLAQSQGVDVGRPGQVRDFVQRRSATLANRERITRRFAERDVAMRAGAAYDAGIDHRTTFASAAPARVSRPIPLAERRVLNSIDDHLDATRQAEARAAGADHADRVQRDALDARAQREDRALTRSNRLAERRRLLAQRRAAVGDAVGRVATGLAGAGIGGILAGNDLLGGYAQRVGVEQFGDLAAIEPRYRSLMGLSGHETRQAELRETVRSKAVAYGLNTGATAESLAGTIAASGNLPEREQRQMFATALRLQSVGGGDLDTLSQGLIATNAIYGDRIGSIDRAGGLFKATADYAKFSTTTLAQLGPDALSYFKQFGVAPEEALATLAVGSLKTGRPENFFTGAKYAASEMGTAIDLGWTTRGASWNQQLKDLAGRSPKELEGVFGREGFTFISNAVEEAPEIARVAEGFRRVRDGDLARQEATLARDPVNTLSRVAASVDVAGSQAFETMLESGGPGGADLAGRAIKVRAAMAGQQMVEPGIAALTDKTKQIDLKRNEDFYGGLVVDQATLALSREGPAGKARAAALKLATGQVEIRLGREATAAEMWASGDYRGLIDKAWDDAGPGGVKRSDGSDADAYVKLVADRRLQGLTATQFAEYQSLRNTGKHAEAETMMAGFARQYARPGPVAPAPGMATPIAPPAAAPPAVNVAPAVDVAQFDFQRQLADARTTRRGLIRAAGMSDSQYEDAQNLKVINDSLAAAHADFGRASKAGDLYAADAARARGLAIGQRRRELAEDADGETATDRRQLAAEIRGTGGGEGQQLAQSIDASIERGVNRLADLLAKLGAGAVPATSPKGPPPGPTRPVNASPPSVTAVPPSGNGG